MFTNRFSLPNFVTRNMLKKKKSNTRQLRGKIPQKKISLSTEILLEEEEERATQASFSIFHQCI